MPNVQLKGIHQSNVYPWLHLFYGRFGSVEQIYFTDDYGKLIQVNFYFLSTWLMSDI